MYLVIETWNVLWSDIVVQLSQAVDHQQLLLLCPLKLLRLSDRFVILQEAIVDKD
jgi:hypothetical protein